MLIIVMSILDLFLFGQVDAKKSALMKKKTGL